jgi:site-specific DNA-methyltransferase (adenine-specific)
MLDMQKGGASRFFYCGKAGVKEKNAGLPDGTENKHPTVKPVGLMEWLCRLTSTPSGGIVLDPFMGSGTTGIGCWLTGRSFVGIDQDEEYCNLANLRISNYPYRKD